jgi:hypothetical protein
VAEIMEPWLVAGTVKSQYSSFSSQPFEFVVGMPVLDHHAYLGGEERRRALVANTWTMPHSVKPEDTDEILSDRNQSGFAEFSSHGSVVFRF